MYTIIDYLKYYKDYDIKEFKWNIMDNLFLSILSYMPVKSFKFKNYDELVLDILKVNKFDFKDLMIPKVIEIIQLIKDSKRYKDMKLINFINRVDSKTQFGALTCSLNNIKIIVFKGTDSSVIGWLENFRLSYTYPTYTQSLAIEYLNKNINIFDNNVYVCGHSKGGNLALVSAMELSNFKYSKIREIDNFDGPGLRYQEYNTLKFKRLRDKLINIIPTGSYVGTLLYNENYTVIKSNSLAINEHYPTSWTIFGTVFIKGNISKLSTELIKRTTVNIKDLDQDKMKEIFEKAFTIFDKKETKNLKLTFNDIVNLLKSVKELDPEISKYTSTIFSTILKLSKDKYEK